MGEKGRDFKSKIFKALEAYTTDKDLLSMIEYALDGSSLVRTHLINNPRMNLNLARLMYKDKRQEVKNAILTYLSNISKEPHLTLDERLQIALISMFYLIVNRRDNMAWKAKLIFKRILSTFEPEIRLQILTKLDASTLADVLRSIDITSEEIDALLKFLREKRGVNSKDYLIALENIVVGRNLKNLPWKTLLNLYTEPQIPLELRILIGQMIIRYLSFYGITEEIAEDIIKLNDWKLCYLLARDLDYFEYVPPKLLNHLTKTTPSIVRLKLAMSIALPLRAVRVLSLDRSPVVRRAILKRGNIPLYVKMNAERVSRMMKKIRRPKRVKWLRRFKIFDLTLSWLRRK